MPIKVSVPVKEDFAKIFIVSADRRKKVLFFLDWQK
jgi:hypothetical protein